MTGETPQVAPDEFFRTDIRSFSDAGNLLTWGFG